MSDLVSRLRDEAEWRNAPQLGDEDEMASSRLATEAADEILRLRAELAALNDGDRVVLPKNLNHAKAMRLAATLYIEREVAGDPVRGVHHQGNG